MLVKVAPADKGTKQIARSDAGPPGSVVSLAPSNLNKFVNTDDMYITQ